MHWSEYKNSNNSYNNVSRHLSKKNKFICASMTTEIFLFCEKPPVFIPYSIPSKMNLHAALAMARSEITSRDIRALPEAFVSYDHNQFLDFHNTYSIYGEKSSVLVQLCRRYDISEKTRIKMLTMCLAIDMIAPLDFLTSYVDDYKGSSAEMFASLSEKLICPEFYIQRQLIANKIDFYKE